MRISFPIFQMFILYSIHLYRMHVRNWCVHWACVSGTDTYAEQTCQDLMRVRSIQARNWCIHWANASILRCAQSAVPSKHAGSYALGTDTYPEHTGQELMHWLSKCVRNWCVPWAYESVYYAYYQHKRKNSNFEKVPSKHADHACTELIHALSVRDRIWCLQCSSRWSGVQQGAA